MSTAPAALNDGLFRVLYCSRNRTAEAPTPDGQALNHILEAARRNNRECGITGALLVSAGYFAQVLEGPRLAIERTFERIQRDDRHHDVTVLECLGIGRRDFPQWSMAKIAPAPGTQAQAARDALFAAMGDPGQSGQEVLEMMRTLLIEAD